MRLLLQAAGAHTLARTVYVPLVCIFNLAPSFAANSVVALQEIALLCILCTTQRLN